MVTKEDLRKEIDLLKKSLAEKDAEIERLKNQTTDEALKELKDTISNYKYRDEERKKDFDYISWLGVNYKHLSRFIRECVEIDIEQEYDYYGNACSPSGGLLVNDPYHLG